MKLQYREVSKQTTVPFIQIADFLLRNFSKEMCSLENVCKKVGAIRLIKKKFLEKKLQSCQSLKDSCIILQPIFPRRRKNFRKRSKIKMFVCFFNNCPAHQVYPEIYKEGKKQLHFLDRRPIEIS